jgi:hypothetical protein
MPNFNDVYLHNYKVLDYGLICKNDPKWGLVSVASGPALWLLFLSFRHVKNMAYPGSFCVKSCVVPTHPLSFLEEEEGEGEISFVLVGRGLDPSAMPPSHTTDYRINYDDEGRKQRDERGSADDDNKQQERSMDNTKS